MTDPGLIRALAFTVPAFALPVVLLFVPRDPRKLGACLLAFTWGLGSLPLVNAAAIHLGWWSYEVEGGVFLGSPMDVMLGWSLLWGPIALVAGRGLPLALIAGFALLFDVFAMPRLEPVLHLGEGWLWGEALALAVVLVPAQCLGRWTWDDRRLTGRVALHLTQFGMVIGFALPHAALVHSGGSWEALASLPRPWPSMALQVLFVLGLPGLAAVFEFAERGGGTPVPFDGPKRVVTSGPYAYVRNPMQVSTALCFAALGLALQSVAVLAIAGMAVVYGAGLAAWHEQSGDLDERLGPQWRAWHGAVRPWLPLWRPYVAGPAVLWVAETCGPCWTVGRWLAARSPVGMEIRPAESHTRALKRIRYEAADGHAEDGVGALARALEHLHLGWAMVGFAARLPGVRHALQLTLDAVGAGPRDLPDRRSGK